MSYPHYSVLLSEVLSYFQDLSIHTFIDGTLGSGGHAFAILDAHPEIQYFIGFDQDPHALSIARERLIPWKSKVIYKQANFSEMQQRVLEGQFAPFHGILLDLGVSSMQLDQPEKGFSFSKEGPLDMRMNPLQTLTAEEIVNQWSENELGKIFRDYGEEKQWRIAAQVLVKARAQAPIKTTLDLVNILYPVLKFKTKKNIHPLTLIFQALRIAVNAELEVIEKVLPEALSLLAPGGRLAVITFHSLEDRLVKNFFRFAASDKYDTSGLGGLFLDKIPEGKILTKKIVVPSDKEIAENPRSRSAKLRVIEKL